MLILKDSVWLDKHKQSSIIRSIKPVANQMQEEPSHKGLSFRIFEKEKEKREKQKRDQVDVKLTLC